MTLKELKEKFIVVWAGGPLLPPRGSKTDTRFGRGERSLGEALIDTKVKRPYNMTRREMKRRLKEIKRAINS